MSNIICADLEAYTKEFYDKHGYIKAYATLGKSLDGKINIFDVSLEKWLEKLFTLKGKYKIFFHNGGKYDFNFIIFSLVKMNLFHKLDIFIDFNKKIYKMKLKIGRNEFLFLDTINLIPRALSFIGEKLNFPKKDYDYKLTTIFNTNEEYKKAKNGILFDYLNRDVDILIKLFISKQELFNYKLTIGSNAISYWKDTINHKRYFLNKLTADEWIICKSAFRGGFTYLMEGKSLKEYWPIYVYDINSLYPFVMMKFKMPYGKPIYDENDPNGTFKLYMVEVEWAVAKKIPFIESYVKGSNMTYNKEIKNNVYHMSNYMLKKFINGYKGKWKITYIFSFREKMGFFDKYLERYRKGKIKADVEKNELERLWNKLNSNCLYGKMGQNIFRDSGFIITKKDFFEYVKDNNIKCYYNKDGKLYAFDDHAKYKRYVKVYNELIIGSVTGDEPEGDFSYIPIAIKITECAKLYLLEGILNNYENYIYSDTDSIHLTAPAKGIKIHAQEYGAWKLEGVFTKGIYRRAKHYALYDGKKWIIKGCGFNVKKANDYLKAISEGKTFDEKEKDDIIRIDMKDYIKERFVVKNGKTISEIVEGGRIIYEKDYQFTS